MTARSKRTWSRLVCLAALVFPIAAAAEAPPTAVLGVKVIKLKSAEGRVGCTLYDKAEGFPKDAKSARQRLWCAIQGSQSTCRFDPIPRGTYAVACFHDENANGRLDTNLLGIPSEGTVASNHAKGTLGPPSFKDAKFTFSGPTELTLNMSY